MKLRLRENSIRLRLSPGEIEQLKQSAIVSEKIQFNRQQSFVYTIAVSNRLEKISAHFEANKLVVEIPERIASNWTETDLISLKTEQAINENSSLEILIEKDFVCSEKPFDSDSADAFPHRGAECQ